MDQDKLIDRLDELIESLGWDYDRMSQAGKDTYTEICSVMAMLKEG